MASPQNSFMPLFVERRENKDLAITTNQHNDINEQLQ